jgi:AbrB family looped-hinge helix DNA binding protein
MEYASLTAKVQIIKPKRIRNKFGFKPGPRVVFQETEKSVAIKPIDESWSYAMVGILEKGDLQTEKATLHKEALAKEKK